MSPSAVPVPVRAGPRPVGGRPRQTAAGHAGWRAGQGRRQRAAGKSPLYFRLRDCCLNRSELAAFRLPVNAAR